LEGGVWRKGPPGWNIETSTRLDVFALSRRAERFTEGEGNLVYFSRLYGALLYEKLSHGQMDKSTGS
jgi:hypothetical protein